MAHSLSHFDEPGASFSNENKVRPSASPGRSQRTSGCDIGNSRTTSTSVMPSGVDAGTPACVAGAPNATAMATESKILVCIAAPLSQYFAEGLRRPIGFRAPAARGDTEGLLDGKAHAGGGIALGRDVVARFHAAAAATRGEYRIALHGVHSGLAMIGKCEHHRTIEQRAVALANGIERLHQLPEELHLLLRESLALHLVAEFRIDGFLVGQLMISADLPVRAQLGERRTHGHVE